MSRRPPAPDPIHVRFGEFELDEANARLLRGGAAVALAPTPFSLLCALARRPGELQSKDALLDAVWGHQFVSESVLKTAISDLRTALGDQPREPRFIETVTRRGYRFIAVPAATPLEPVPAAPAGRDPGPSFVGRADALARLRAAWQQTCGGQRAVVWVAGEPGIGKTTLIEQFVDSLGGIVSVRGQCVEHHGVGEPYLPVLEALAELCRKDSALPGLLRSVAPTWLMQLPWLASAEERHALRRELAGVGAERMLREMGELLERSTDQRPLLLVTEDLHWSDRATVQLIDHFARRRGRAHVMWLASFRVAEVVATDHPLNALRRELRLHRLCEEVVLDPFAETEVADCIAQRSPSLARDEAFVRALHRRTDGVPLFVSSVLAEVLQAEDGDESARARLEAVAVPENLAAIIDHYVDRLETEQRELLTAAAVCGVDFRAGTVARALGRDAAAVALACDALSRSQVWLTAPRNPSGVGAQEPPYAFRHALFRQVLYDRIPAMLRAELHARVGAALEDERAAGAAVAATELATHFDRGRQVPAALRHYADAAQAALRQFSPAACLDDTGRALALLPQAPPGNERDMQEITLATLRGIAAFQALGCGDEARNAFDRAFVLLDAVPAHPLRGRLLHGFGYLLNLRGEYARALEVAQRAEALSAGVHDPVLMLAACFLQGQAHHLQGQTESARPWIERGLAIARAPDLAAARVFAADPQVTLLGMLAIDLVRCGRLEAGRAHAQQARDRAQALRQPITRLVAAWQEALMALRLDDAQRVAALADEMQGLVDEFGLEQGTTGSLRFRGWAQARLGRPAEGVRLILAAYDESLRQGMRAGASEVLGYASETLLRSGDAGAAQARLDEALRFADDLGERVYLPQLMQLEAAVARASGRADAGAAALRRSIAEARSEQAAWLELLALVDLCEHHAATAKERQRLAALIDALPEAAATEPVRRARSL